MRFLPFAVLSLATFGAEAVVEDVPTEAPRESDYPVSLTPFDSDNSPPVESEFPFSTTPIEFDYSETFYPDAGNCREYPKDTHAYITWKLNKTFGAWNCETRTDWNFYAVGGVKIKCFVKIRSWFNAFVEYDAIPQTKTKEDNPNPDPYDSENIKLPDFEPHRLYFSRSELPSYEFTSETLDFETKCMRELKNELGDVEVQRENPEDAPTMAPEEPQQSYFPNGSEYPISTTPFFHTGTMYPDESCKVYPRDTDGYIRWKLNKTFGKDNCSMTSLPDNSRKVDCRVVVPNWFTGIAEYVAIPNTNPNNKLLNYESTDEFEPISLALEDSNVAGYSFREDLDFQYSCIDTIRDSLRTIETRRENPEDAPVLSDYPTSAPNGDEPAPFSVPISWPTGEDSPYPFSDEQSSIYPSSFPMGKPCPETHEDIIQVLYDSFGEENCRLVRDYQQRDYISREINCEYTNPTWFKGSAWYSWAVRDGEDISVEISVTESLKYGVSGQNYIDLTCIDYSSDIGPNGTCLEKFSFLKSIKQKRLNPQDGPQCDNAEGPIQYRTNKSITCSELAGLPHKKRNKRCAKKKILQESCPGVCQVEPDCKCINSAVKFPTGKSKDKKKFFTCERLRNESDKNKIRKRCERATYIENCPSICLTECEEMF